jgi:hypothetical protein
MRPINQHAQRIMDRLASLAEAEGGSVRIDNTEGAFMPLCVELLPRERISLAHYGECNGDPMRDPEMVFWRAANGRHYPVYFRNDYAGIEREAVLEFGADGMPVRYYRREQADQAVFAGTWLRNIREQQGV